jgi:hypothetical protein
MLIGTSALSNSFYNNLFFSGSATLGHDPGGTGRWTFCDNLFDQTAITQYGTIDVCHSNAYVEGFPTLASTANSPAVVLSESPAYETGALGSHYYAAGLPLIHAGSRSAAAAGLYDYTVTTDNVVEGTNMVSIGFHYVAEDTNGNPLSTYIPGIPDYIVDANGTGVYSSGDLLDWMNPFAIYDQGRSYGGYYPANVRLGYWKFDNTNTYPNQAGSTPTNNTDRLAATMSARAET